MMYLSIYLAIMVRSLMAIWQVELNFDIYVNYLFLKRLSLQLWTFFESFYFVFNSFVKVELNYVFTINLFTIAENCTEKWIIL